MRSILEHLKELHNDEYKYYSASAVDINIINSNKIDDHRQFIFDYFSDGGKHKIVDKFFNHEDGFDRARHTSSVFFLGCLLYKKLELRDKIDFYIRDHDQFYFIWFLVSLAHDFSYKYEDDFEKYSERVENEIFNLRYDLLTPEHPCNSPHLIELQNYIKGYFERRFNQCTIDHGIVAGMKLYHGLVENRLEQKDEFGIEDTARDLYWGDDLDPLYHCAGLAVATHNIWFNNSMPDKVKNCYPISMNNYPLLFLLGLIDTLDPVKTFDCVDPVYVLENILIDFPDNNMITFKIKDGSVLDFKKLIKKAKGLKSWLDVDIKDPNTNDGLLTITIKDENNEN